MARLIAWMLSVGLVALARAQAPPMTANEHRDALRKQSAAVQAATKAAVQQLNKLSIEMEALGMKGEADDCKRILEKCLDPGKPLPKSGGSTPWPGEDMYFTKVLDRFAAVGQELSAAYLAAAAAAIEPPELKEQLEIVGLWLGTFPEVAAHMKHFNQRRKECKLGPVTCSWSSSYGGFMHGRYMALNANDSSTAGLGGHNESPKLKGASTEGAAAAKGIGGGGWFDGWMSLMFHRAPVFDPGLSRVAYGGYQSSFWCAQISGGNKQLANLITFPGDGATNVSGIFSGEHPNPLPAGVERTGTMIVIQFYGSKPQGFAYTLRDPQGTALTDVIEFSKANPVVFATKKTLSEGLHTVELVGVDFKHAFKFTVGAGPWNTGLIRQPPRETPPPPVVREPKVDPKPPAAGSGSEVKPPEPPPVEKPPEPKVEEKPEPKVEEKPAVPEETGNALERAFKRVGKATEEDRPDRVADLYLAWTYASRDEKIALCRAVGIDALRGKGLPHEDLTQIGDAAGSAPPTGFGSGSGSGSK